LLLALAGSASAEERPSGDVSGFYAGIYALGGQRNDTGFEEIQVSGAVYDTAGPTPAIGNPGFPPLPFELFQAGLSYYPTATSVGYAANGLDGLMSSGAGLGAGLVAGYAFGNGFRIEADLSNISFAPRSAEFDGYTYATGLARFVGGAWDWTYRFEDQGPSSYTADLSELAYGTRLRTSGTFLLANGYYDIDTATGITPYIGGGIGVALVSSELQLGSACSSCVVGNGFDDSALVPAAQLGGGVRFALADPVTLDIGYRYKVAASSELATSVLVPDNGNGTGFDGLVYRQTGVLGIHSIQAGFTFAFQ
jgi:opacity protein-like surface antigen